VPQKGYGDLGTGQQLGVRRLEHGCNLDVTARMLLNGDFTFCPICDSNGLHLPSEPFDNFCAISRQHRGLVL